MKTGIPRGAAAIVLAAVLFLTPLSKARAAINLFWTGANSTNYDDGQNWSFYEGVGVPPAGALPTTGNFAVFEKSASLSFSGQPPTPDNLQIFNGNVSFALGPVSYHDATALTYTTNQLYVVAPFEDGNFLQGYNLPNGANASLFISAGGLVVHGQAVVGAGNSKNVGTLTLQASDMQLTDGLTVAQTGHGYLNIETGSYVTSSGGNNLLGSQSGSVGTATVSGGSTWLLDATSALAVESGCNLSVLSGGTVAGTTLNIGGNGQTAGSVLVNGAGSRLSFPNMMVGIGGNGTLTIQNGAAVISGGSNATAIGAQEGISGTATVSGAGSQWNTGGLSVGGGHTGHGALTISAGATVNSSDYYTYGSGTATLTSTSIAGNQSSVVVQGNGSLWNITGGLSVAWFNNTGVSLSVENGGTVSVATTLQVNQGGTVQVDGTLTAGTINVSGGTVTQTGTVTISDATHAGTLSINNGGIYIGAPTLGVASSGSSAAGSQVTVNGNGSTWTIPGPYTLGASGGLVTANVQTGGTVSSADLGIGTNSQLNVDGWGSLWASSGTISVGTVSGGSVGITNGAALSASTIEIGPQGKVTVNNSMLSAPTLAVIGGNLKLGSGTLATTNTSVPSGFVQMFGAAWNNNAALCVGNSGAASATVYMNGGTATNGGPLKIAASGQLVIDGGANLNANSVTIAGGSLDVWNGQVNSSGGSLTVSAHGEYSQSSGDFNGAGFNNVAVNAALFNIQQGSINIGPGQIFAATNGAVVLAPQGTFTVTAGGQASVSGSTLNVSNLDVAGALSLNGVALQTQNFQLDGGTLTAVTPLYIQSKLGGNGLVNGNIQLDGGSIEPSGGAMAINGNITGYGVLIGNVAATSLTGSGDLVVSGTKNQLGNQSVVLLSQHAAQLTGTLTSGGGTVTSASGFDVVSGGVIQGNINIVGDVENDGLIAVGGDAIGQDSIFGNLLLDDSGIIRVKIGGTDPSQYDHIKVKNGDVTLGGTLDLVFVDGFVPKQGDTFNIFIDDFSGSFSQTEVDGLGAWQYSVAGSTSGVTLDSLSDAVPAPEPGTLLLLGAAACVGAFYWRRSLRRPIT